MPSWWRGGEQAHGTLRVVLPAGDGRRAGLRGSRRRWFRLLRALAARAGAPTSAITARVGRARRRGSEGRRTSSSQFRHPITLFNPRTPKISAEAGLLTISSI